MADLQFAWDPRKDRANQKKHGIGFIEAKTVFLDEFARIIPDAGGSTVDFPRYVGHLRATI
jgi:uncharacterized DUF497 family protein